MALTLPIFPVQPSAYSGFSVHKRPTFASLVHAPPSGREVTGFQMVYPLWEFELTYEVLRDQSQNSAPFAPTLGYTELQALSAFWVQLNGQFGSFVYSDPDDNSRLGQHIAVGDGATLKFIMVRTFGTTAYNLVEPVGIVDNRPGVSIDIFLNGVLQTNGWQLDTDLRTLVFDVAPSAGVVITADFSFFYFCRFIEDSLELEEFMTGRWMVKSLKFRSTRPDPPGGVTYVLPFTPPPTGPLIYATGQFTQIGGRSVTGLDALDATTGDSLGFLQSVIDAGVGLALSPDAATLYAGNGFISAGTTRFAIFNPVWSPSTNITSVQPPGPVQSVVAAPTTTYVGGSFNSPGNGTGCTVDATTGFPTRDFPTIGNYLECAVPDGVGGWYISGSFTNVGGLTRQEIAHILANNTVDTAFNPSYTTLGGPVYAIALTPDGTTLYFMDSNGATTNIRAVTTATGAMLPLSVSANGVVYNLVVSPDGTTLYASGSFTTIGGQSRLNVAAINLGTGLVTSFNPGGTYPGTGINNGNRLIVSADNATLYLTGPFTVIGGQSRDGIAALHTSSGLAASFNPGGGGGVGKVLDIVLSPDESLLYAVGSFSSIGGQTRSCVAAINVATGLATSFNPGLTATHVNAVACSSDGATLYIGGSFTAVSGVYRGHIAGISTSTGLVTSFIAAMPYFTDPSGLNYPTRQQLMTNSVNPQKVFVGGICDSVGLQTALFGFNPTSKTLNFIPIVAASGTVNAIAVSADETIVYVGGLVTKANGVTRHFLAAINRSDGSVVTAFDPNPNDQVTSLTLSADGTILYVGGYFTTISGVTRNHLAAVHTSNGAIVTAFADPVLNGRPEGTMILTADQSKLYIGGEFTTINGVGHSKLAAINTSNGTVVSAFAPSVSGGTNGVRGMVLSEDEATLYFCGGFTSVNATTRNRMARVNTADGSLVTAFNPNANALVRNMLAGPNTLPPTPPVISPTLYFEATLVGGNTEHQPAIGIASLAFQLQNPAEFDAGVVTITLANGLLWSFPLAGAGALGWGYPNRPQGGLGGSVGTVVGVAINMTISSIWIRDTAAPSTWYGDPTHGTPDPVTGLNGFTYGPSGDAPITGDIFILGGGGADIFGPSSNASVTLNSAGPFVATPPSGFVAWGDDSFNPADAEPHIVFSGLGKTITLPSTLPFGSNQPTAFCRGLIGKPQP